MDLEDISVSEQHQTKPIKRVAPTPKEESKICLTVYTMLSVINTVRTYTKRQAYTIIYIVKNNHH